MVVGLHNRSGPFRDERISYLVLTQDSGVICWLVTARYLVCTYITHTTDQIIQEISPWWMRKGCSFLEHTTLERFWNAVVIINSNQEVHSKYTYIDKTVEYRTTLLSQERREKSPESAVCWNKRKNLSTFSVIRYYSRRAIVTVVLVDDVFLAAVVVILWQHYWQIYVTFSDTEIMREKWPF